MLLGSNRDHYGASVAVFPGLIVGKYAFRATLYPQVQPITGLFVAKTDSNTVSNTRKTSKQDFFHLNSAKNN